MLIQSPAHTEENRCGVSLRLLTRACIWWLILSAALHASEGPAYNSHTTTAIPPTFFGMHMHKPVLNRQPWPTVPFGTVRLWDSGVSWGEINSAQGRYNWSILDDWLSKYREHGIADVLYTFGRVPRWASSKPHDSSCAFADGACAPPDDIKRDGSGTDQHWKDFVAAIATHNQTSHAAHISQWEIWNEPHNERMWMGSNAQLLRMARDARSIILSIDPSAVIVSHPSGIKAAEHQEWLQAYLRDGGGQPADVIAIHGYVHTGRPGVYPVASDIIAQLKALLRLMGENGLGSKPVFDTEAGWGRASVMGFETDEDFQAGFLAQFYLLHWSAGVRRLYWYSWNNSEFGTLWSPDPANPAGPGRLHAAAIAYGELYKWMVGATMEGSCAASNGIWTCPFSRPAGYEALAVWAGATRSYSPNPKFKSFRDLIGHSGLLRDGKIDIGFRPILLENKPPAQ